MLYPLLADGLAPAGDPWPWICGILAVANAAQFWLNAKERDQNRTDLLALVVVMTEVKAVMADVKETLK